MQPLTILAHAKINFTLDVVRRRPDGYHEVDMILQSLALADEVTLAALPDEPGTVRLSCDAPGVPEDERNLAWRAAQALRKACPFAPGLAVTIRKRIPAAAGLAGGSADAAAVLAGADRLFSLGLSAEELAGIGLTLGADVPFCLKGGTARARGVGEKLESLPGPKTGAVLLAKPAEGVSTAAVYGALRIGTRGPYPHVDTDGAVRALRAGDLAGLSACAGNLLQEVTQPMLPVVGDLARIMRENGALTALMSGSGPTVYGIFADPGAAGEAAAALPADVWRAVTAFAGEGVSFAQGTGRSFR